MEAVNGIKHIEKSYNENKLSHAFLVETNNFEKCLEDIKKIIKLINCKEKYVDNCEKCNLCYQIEKETLPNFQIIRPDGITIKKEQIINLKEKMLTKPVYSKYNTYVILNSEKLNNSSSNTMLKFIEEPEDYLIGFFVVNNKENVIETIRSRCQLIHQYYIEEEIKIDDEKLETVKDYIKNIELDNKHIMLYNKNILMEKNYTREELMVIFQQIFKVYENVYINGKYENFEFLKDVNSVQLLNKMKIINKYLDNLQKNGNINLLLDSFVIEMGHVK